MKKKLTQQEVDAIQAKNESLVGQSNGVALTTWLFCWRCGEKFNVKNRNEVTSGVHTRCSTDAILSGPRENRTYPSYRYLSLNTLRKVGVVLGIGVDPTECTERLQQRMGL